MLLNLLFILYIISGITCFTSNILYSVIAIIKLKNEGLKLGRNKIVLVYNFVINVLMSAIPFLNYAVALTNIIHPIENISAFKNIYIKKEVVVDSSKYNGRTINSSLRRSGKVEELSSVFNDLSSVTESMIIDGADDKQIVKECSKASRIMKKSKKEDKLEKDAKELMESYTKYADITREQAINLLKNARQYLRSENMENEKIYQKNKKTLK